MAQCRSNIKVKESVRARTTSCANKEDGGCDARGGDPSAAPHLPDDTGEQELSDTNHHKGSKRANTSLNLRSSSRSKPELQPVPDVGRTGSSPTTHSNMKTKQAKEESDKSIDEDTIVEPKTRARKKASDINEEEKKLNQDDPKTSKETRKTVTKPKAIVKKRPLGIRKTLRSKKAIITKDKIKSVIKQTVTRGRKAAVKTEPGNSQEKETVPLIPASEIKKEPLDDTPNSRSSSPKTAGRRPRQTSDMMMVKSVLGDAPSSLVIGPRTSPYSMRSERSNSPLLSEGKNLRSGKPRKVKNNLLNEVVMKEQKKRRRLLSDSKPTDATDVNEDCKKLKRGRSCSRDGSEISKCSDITESDLSLSETLNDDSKELNKKLEKSKTDLDIDIENIVQISTTEKVPSLTVDSNIAETKMDAEPSCISNEKDNKNLSLKRSTSLDSDNNNSNRLKLDNLNASDIEDKLLLKTENDTLFEARSSILTSMSKTFNSKEMSKNIRKARRGRRAASRPNPNAVIKTASTDSTSTIVTDAADDKHETLETLSKEIDDLINNLDQNIDRDHEIANTTNSVENSIDESQTKAVSKFYGLSKPLGDNNSIISPDTPVKDKDSISSLSITSENTPSKNDDSENIRLHYDEDSVEKTSDSKHGEITYKVNPVASIDKLMDRLKEFEEFDKRRQRQESESKSNDSKSVMVSNDVVLIQKSGTDIKPLKDIQCVRSPERPFEKENVLSCFENNSAISIVKRDHVRKSLDVDLPNSVTLIKRNSVSARKESTSSNHSKDADAISIFEKSLGKDVTLTEIRKSVDKSGAGSQIDLNQFAALHTNTSNQNLMAGVVLDSNQISITPRVVNEAKSSSSDIKIITKRKSRESLSRKSSESANESEEKLAILEKIKTPVSQVKAQSVAKTPAPVAVKSEATQPKETEALPPPIDNIKPIPENTTTTTDVGKVEKAQTSEIQKSAKNVPKVLEPAAAIEEKIVTQTTTAEATVVADDSIKNALTEKMVVDEQPDVKTEVPKEEAPVETKEVSIPEEKPEKPKAMAIEKPVEVAKPVRSLSRNSNKSRTSTECLAGPSNVLLETPESQKRKENILRTLGLLTHKAAKEAKIEKLKEKERIYKSKVAKSASGASVVPTGSLKAVIKLNRGTGDRDKKKFRSSLKMTFQKSKNRSGKPAPEGGEAADEDDTYYTIERREGGAGATTDGGHRKSHYSNRLNNHDTEAVPEPVEPKETLNLVIPEKASSFSIHPGRLCQDQCFYCGGKFGLFDTPCHIAQMKSAERQKKVLDNEEKLTSDSCLCDACFRHVDRRANCPSYRKRPLVKQPTDMAMLTSSPANVAPGKPPSPPGAVGSEDSEDSATGALGARGAACHTEGCGAPADHSIRRKWLIKMRSSVNKVLKLECDYPGLHTIPLCADHHRLLAPLTACALCRRRITKHHNVHFIHHGYTELNPMFSAAGIPVQFLERPLLCKMCRVYCSLLQRQGHDHQQTRGYRRKLLQIYNIEVPPEIQNEPIDAILQDDNITNNKQKKKQRTKSKQRKSTDPEKTGDSESSERTTPHDEGSPEKLKEESNDAQKLNHPIEEDIESLISSNKIMVPGAKPPSEHMQSDGSESEIFDMDSHLLPIDKQTELQYLLQKQNNPAQFMPKTTNLTQKQRNIMKLQAMSGIQKPGHQHRINEKNAKRIHKLGQIVTHKDKSRKDEIEIFDPDKTKESGITIMKNMSLNDECTIETIPNKKPADINTLKNKWQMSESFTQVKKNLSELSKKLDKEPKKLTEKYSNPVKRLETNPSISVRELFPGEEEMNLQCNIEFGNVKGVTPEGWEKCNTMIRYDEETKRLWNELQRPYGNQSSFLRHLVLLEKYFRSGDLVLSHAASPHAAGYSDAVQSRLKAYDNLPPDPPREMPRPSPPAQTPPVSLIDYRKKPSVNGKSLLKSNQGEEKDPKKFMPPPGVLPKPKQPKSSDKSKSKALPPELIAINTPNAQGRKAIQNVLHNIQQLVKGVSASDPTEVASAPLPVPVPVAKFDTPPPVKFEPPPNPPPVKEKKETPKTDTLKKTKPTSKPWRPTLMPITAENLARIAREPTQVAVDGRTLPSLVQVMSSGKRYHITLQDYNKMCVMRREKLQQLQDRDSLVTEVQTSALLGNGGTVVQNVPIEDKADRPKDDPELAQIGSNAANILKNVGLKNITIAPIPAKTATVTSQTIPAPFVTSPSLLVTSAPIKIPQLGPAVSITSETVMASPAPTLAMPKIPKSLTVIPQPAPALLPASLVPLVPLAPAPPDVTRP